MSKIEKTIVSGDTVYIPSEYYPYGTTTSDNIIIEDDYTTYPLGDTVISPGYTFTGDGTVGIWQSGSSSVNISSGNSIYNVFD